MRKHGWQLPYHPLQVVAIAVFLALGFAFYVFFAPFVGKKLFQYVAMGIYTPLIISVFGLYISCAAADPGDPGVFRSKKYLNIPESKKIKLSESKHGEESTSSVRDVNARGTQDDANDEGKNGTESAADCNTGTENKNASFHQSSCFSAMLALSPCACVCNSNEKSSDQTMREDGMFYCSLCEVEVSKYSKHCRVCDKCVDRFDHHCRWLNNCIGKRNYRKFFTLTVSALLLLILQWSAGILVLILCFLEKKQFATDISSKLGSSFTVVPFVIVVAVCTILAMIATLPLAQLFFFHILLIKKGISTYDYIIALREQEQQASGGQHSPQMSSVSSITGLSSTSSFNNFHRTSWCTPPQMFLEDQFDAVPPDNRYVSSLGKKTMVEEPTKKNSATVKISPWTLARLNAEDVSKAVAEARKKSKILRPVVRRESTHAPETDSSFGSSGPEMILRHDNNRKRGSKHIRLTGETSMSLAPLQLEARGAFMASQPMPGSASIIPSSPESSSDSPDLHPLRVSSSGAEEATQLVGPSTAAVATQKEIALSRSTSDGYDASGGEDSDQVPTRIPHRPTNWSSLIFSSEQDRTVPEFMPPSSSAMSKHRKL